MIDCLVQVNDAYWTGFWLGAMIGLGLALAVVFWPRGRH